MAVTPPENQTTVRSSGQVDLAVYESGPADAECVVLVHGYPDTHVVWDAVAKELSKRFHVVAYDVRGAGASTVPKGRAAFDLDRLMDDLDAVITATAPGQNIHLVGHDWGSIQAWEAVTCGRFDDRILTFTSISGPCLDHIGGWIRRRRTLKAGPVRELLAQGIRSWYVVFFQVPLLAPLAWRTYAARGFRRYLTKVEGVDPDGRHPEDSLAADGANGVNLYRRNIPSRLRHPRPAKTAIPVQVIVPSDDRFVSPKLLDDTHLYASSLTRRNVRGGHWIVATQPEDFAQWVSEFIDTHRPTPPDSAG